MDVVLSSACRARENPPLHIFPFAMPEISMPAKRKATVLHHGQWTVFLSKKIERSSARQARSSTACVASNDAATGQHKGIDQGDLHNCSRPQP